MDVSMVDSRSDPLALIVGQLIRLYTKSKSLSGCLRNFHMLDQLVELMQSQQFHSQSDALKTMEHIFRGGRIYQKLEVSDPFIDWVDNHQDD